MTSKRAGLSALAGLLALLVVAGAGAVADDGAPVDLPTISVREPQPVLSGLKGDPVRARAVGARVAPLLRDASVRGHVGVAVADVESGELRWDSIGDDLARETFVPASTLKLFTAVAALTVLEPDHRFDTSVVRTGGPRSGELVLVGGGDPLLRRHARSGFSPVDTHAEPASLTELAADTARELRADGVRKVRLAYDADLFTGPALNPTWPSSYVTDGVVTPISALWVSEGRLGPYLRSTDPARDAAEAFATSLQRAGVDVVGAVEPGSGDGGRLVAQVRSAPLDQLVMHTLALSDNEAAEVLLRHLALGTQRPGSFAGGVAAMREVLTELGVPMAGVDLHDGSGLSRLNTVTLPAVLGVLQQAAAGADQLRAVATGLPVAAFDGTAAVRFLNGDARAGRGVVQAKTGTLTGVHGLAGTLVTRQGAAMTFVALTDRVPVSRTYDARDQLDRIVATLAACGCR
ncbi:MAG TPA: D-alanyl-D-alanine carboxypeptidase/D-alanyl-D-alanine-endopeptidase [Nocardioidaceae bacterium]|nr:D-alanyl-D-alanine carboxypeptidase/D-alanyl-D-alanine-endopeptidase [Nocardioidaceae bacterium]